MDLRGRWLKLVLVASMAVSPFLAWAGSTAMAAEPAVLDSYNPRRLPFLR